jgi:hypothetical protein
MEREANFYRYRRVAKQRLNDMEIGLRGFALSLKVYRISHRAKSLAFADGYERMAESMQRIGQNDRTRFGGAA